MSPIDFSELSVLLASYKDKNFILRGFAEGFRLAFNGFPSTTDEPNASSLKDSPDEAVKKVASEWALHRIAGPFDEMPFTPSKCSPLSLKPKATPGKFRLLHDLSAPHDGCSVNEG